MAFWDSASLDIQSKPRQYIKNQRHCFADRDLYSQSYGVPSSHVWMWELDQTPKNGCFPIVVLEKILESPNQSVLKEIRPEYSLEGLNLKLKFQYFGQQMRITDSLEKTLILGKIERGKGEDRGWDGWMASLTQWTRVWASSRRWWRTGKPGVLQSMGLQRIVRDWATE